MQVKIYYHHTDCGGVVYYANYLNFLEEARTEFFAQKGVSIKELADCGTLFVVARQEIDYKLPSFYGDILTIQSKVAKSSGVRLEFEHEITNQNKQVITKAKTILVCVDKCLKPKAVPEDIHSLITQ